MPLRYNLAGYRPSKTAHLALSPPTFSEGLGEIHRISKRGVTLLSRLSRDSLLRYTVKIDKSMPNYSKTPRGLFVQVHVGRVFTATAISPSRGLRQLLARDAIRAGRNLPDKELRYRRTVIVTAAVYWSLSSEPVSPKGGKTPPLNLPALGRRQPVYIRLTLLHGHVFLINSRLINFSCNLANAR